MKKGIAIFALTIVVWFLIVALYGRWYISDGIAHPEALNRVPVDMEALALDRDPQIQLINFAMFRFPFLFAGIAVAVWIEIKLLSGKEEAHAQSEGNGLTKSVGGGEYEEQR